MRFALPALLLAATIACGGEGGSSPPPTENPPGNTVPNPCPTAEMADTIPSLPREQITTPTNDQRATSNEQRARAKDPASFDGSTRWRVLEDLWINRQAEARDRPGRRSEPGRSIDPVDVGSISVVQDEGDLIVPPNPWDLRSTGLRFTSNAAGGYDVRRTDGSFRRVLGNRVTLTDDDTQQVAVPFAFDFYGRRQTAGFVNSDGNITFGEGDSASTERNVARLLSGPPRVAPFLADLDPSAGGSVYVNAASDQYTVTWCGVRGFESSQVTTVQATLLPDGAVEMTFGGTITLDEAIVGLSPGATTQFTTVDFSAAAPLSGGSAALGERFAAFDQIDTVAIARKFYRNHTDVFDQLVIWTDASIVRDSFAYETTVANGIQGLGIDIYSLSDAFGSGGRLESLTIMDALSKYRDDPSAKILNEATTLAVLAHEVAHRWLAFFTFRDHRGEISEELLGRDRAHWSFFMDSDASVMEGNDIQDQGGGSFRTIGAMSGYSALDLYAMGLLSESDVSRFFYVESPVNVSPSRSRESAPTLNVTFNGTRKDVLIQDIIVANGSRKPSSAEAPRQITQAFLYVVGAGRTAAPDQIEKLDRIRRQWEGFIVQATGGRMRALTSLR